MIDDLYLMCPHGVVKVVSKIPVHVIQWFFVTVQGFKVLVEREWLGYGHKFGERCGLTTDDGNQQSPVFLQWLDCVHQLTRQYPCDFQFNENFLVSK